MRKVLFYTGIALVAVFALTLGAAFFLLEPDKLAAMLVAQVEARTGLPVELDSAGVKLFPLPAAELNGVLVGPKQEPLIAADALRVSVSPLPLLFGKVAIRSLELETPRIVVPTNQLGELELPIPPAAGAQDEAEDGETLGIAISRYVIRNGSIRYRDWQLENVEASGEISLSGAASLRLDADVQEIGELREVEFEIDDVRADIKRWSASGRASSLQLAALRQRLQPDLNLELAGNGDLQFEIAPGNAWLRLDLDRAQAELPGVFRKPDGAPLRIEARPSDLSSGVPDGPFELTLGSQSLSGTLRDQTLELEQQTLALSELSRWIQHESLPDTGEIQIARLLLGFSPLSVTGDANLQGLEIPVGTGVVRVSGPLQASGNALSLDPLSLQVGNQTAMGSARYQLGDGTTRVKLGTQNWNLENAVTALRGDYTVGGRMDSAIELSGPPSLDRIRGAGTLDLVDGRIQGASFVRAILGKLADIGMLVAALKGKDLSRYEEEEFERLMGRYQIRDGKVHFEKLVIDYEFTTADLRGSLAIADGTLDLSGNVILSKELQDELTGEAKRVEKRVIPIAGVGCTVRRPCIQLDGRAVASVLGTLVSGGELREKLEETIGKEGVGILEQLLRGGNR